MRFRHRRSESQLPEVNLVPMMDVLMTVLTFFIIVSMTLTGQQILNVQLPETSGKGTNSEAATQKKLLVGLNLDRQIVIDDRPISSDQLAQAMQTFFSQNPNGIVLLKADRKLTYDTVAQLLKTMRDIGGDRVSLAIERQGE
ncbi:MAG TPA: biopolymer transporter ExbD [Trichocoleus sp.]